MNDSVNRSIRSTCLIEASADHDRSPTLPASRLIAQRIMELLARADKVANGRVLVFDPPADTLVVSLRAMGFTGQIAVVRSNWSPPATSTEPSPETLASLDDSLHESLDAAHRFRCDWRAAASSTKVDALFEFASEHVDVIVVRDALDSPRIADVVALARWLTGFLAPRGFLILDDSINLDASDADASRADTSLAARQAVLERLSEAGVLPITDDTLAIDDVPHSLSSRRRMVVTTQYRGASECQQSGVLRRVTLADLDADPALQANIVSAYRDVFGGDEWREWMRCPARGCGRQYSQSATAALVRPGWCECGSDQPLVPFHSPEQVADTLRRELADNRISRCYVRHLPDGTVGAFIWGYVTTREQLVETLLGSARSPAHTRFLSRLRDAVHGDVADERIYYQSQIGVVAGARGFSVLRALIHRALQFASDQGISEFATRTHPRAAAYTLLQGLDLQIVHRYDTGAADAPAVDAPKQPHAEMSSSRATEPEQRLVFAGGLQPIVTLTLAEGDRRIALHLAHRLRAQQAEAAPVHSVHLVARAQPATGSGDSLTEAES